MISCSLWASALVVAWAVSNCSPSVKLPCGKALPNKAIWGLFRRLEFLWTRKAGLGIGKYFQVRRQAQWRAGHDVEFVRRGPDRTQGLADAAATAHDQGRRKQGERGQGVARA